MDIDQQQALISQLADILPKQSILTDEQSKQYYGTDWTTIYQASPLCIVLPETTTQVQKIVQLANQLDAKIVPSAGRTGYSGGAVAANNEIVLSVERMNQIQTFNPVDRTVHCQAGVITQQLQQFAEEKGLYYPVNFASAGSSRIGGNIGTNAGGIRVIHYGSTCRWVAGLTAIMGNGELLQLEHNLIKNASGYNLCQLLIGSEGTLGIITEATMRLTRKPQHTQVALISVEQFQLLPQILAALTQQLDLLAFEFFAENALQYVLTKHQLDHPYQQPTAFYALIETECSYPAAKSQLLTTLNTLLQQHLATDIIISQNLQQAQQLWQFRELISESIYDYKPHKYDLSVLTSQMPAFITALETILEAYPEYEAIYFGHIGDGNIHLNLLKPPELTIEDFNRNCQVIDTQIFSLIKQFKGSISAEHGIGLIKKDFLNQCRNDTEIQLMKQIKQVFDPKHILNPGKLFPTDKSS